MKPREGFVKIFRQLVKENELATLEDGFRVSSDIKEIQKLSENIFRSSAAAETFLYFCLHGAATSWVLQTELNQPDATVYRAMKRLRAVGLISPALKVSVQSSEGGPRPTIWALSGASGDEIAAALKHHKAMRERKGKRPSEEMKYLKDKWWRPSDR